MRTNFWNRGDFFIWLTGATLSFSLLMVSGLLFIVVYNGLGFFWPNHVTHFYLTDGTFVQGEALETETIPQPGQPDAPKKFRTKIKRGNRDLYGLDFVWIPNDTIQSKKLISEVVVFERLEWGNFYGSISAVKENAKEIATGVDNSWKSLNELLPRARGIYHKIQEVQKEDIGIISHDMERIRLNLKQLFMKGVESGESVDDLNRNFKRLQEQYQRLENKITELKNKLVYSVVVSSADGREKEIPLYQIVRAYRPNTFGFFDKAGFFAAKVWEFFWEDPRESNTEGGIFPAIFGTVMMVVLMSFFATPLGVLAAFYLREYARPGPFVSMVRIAVNNLAGVPSIVFGVFGVGFFIYTIGGSLDRLFFPEALPTPTFGTGGILWASLTLALLTVPVVIVSTEEGLAAVPSGIREASLALGSTKAETLWRTVFPAVMPSVLTGLILAMARAAGEVAPLMITGVVKLAPSLPVDGFWPFIHLERKFMHLGFHIYDVGFQSPNVDAARPMVFTTTLLLILIVLLLNWMAILLRNRLRQKLYAGGF